MYNLIFQKTSYGINCDYCKFSVQKDTPAKKPNHPNPDKHSYSFSLFHLLFLLEVAGLSFFSFFIVNLSLILNIAILYKFIFTVLHFAIGFLF